MTHSTMVDPQGMEDCCPLEEADLQVKYIFISPRRRVLRMLSKTVLILQPGKPKVIICVDVFQTVYKASFSALAFFKA